MSKCNIRLKLKDLYAIKHAIEKTLSDKKHNQLANSLTEKYNLSDEELKQLSKDIEHEEKLLKQIKEKIDSFEEYIGR
ncbi:hypothetical protein KQI41_01060 [Tissierella pigra]|uniref:hypothetical protein n=1 Tax=Tissierella pigra TaxID=2607614 RepID=UPI001C1269A1|nr:hypothetical protein [Tissierella pigra]MBU5424984.1 hypothetical protein [Tissierella pigra]